MFDFRLSLPGLAHDSSPCFSTIGVDSISPVSVRKETCFDCSGAIHPNQGAYSVGSAVNEKSPGRMTAS